METTRQNKIARLIQKDLAGIFQAQTRQTKNLLVSVSVVRVSPDLSVAKAYLSIFPSEKQGPVMQLLEENNRALRGELGHVVAKQLRIVPELVFLLDTSLDYAEHIEELLKK